MGKKSCLSDLLQLLHKASASPFEQAHPIPAQLNHSKGFGKLERRSIFEKEWICVGREDEFDGHGSYLTHEIAGVSILVVKQKSGQIGAFVNACAHRFACLVPSQSGKSKKFTCRYHAWSYDCEGRLISAPHMEMRAGFDKSDHRLHPLAVAVWEGFVYVTLNEDPVTIPKKSLRPLRDNIVGRYNMACYKTVLREKMRWNANWKNLIENFIESYHVPVAHGKTFAKHEKPITDYLCGEDNDYYCYHLAPQHSKSGPGAAHKNNDRLEREWRRTMVDFCVFPCHLITLMPDYLWWISVQPQGTDKFDATWGVAVPPEILDDVSDAEYKNWLENLRNYMDVANDEDKVIVEALHLGSRSRLLPCGTFHPIERNLWQFNRYLARVCGANQQST